MEQDLVDLARQVATPDVRSAIDWLLAHDFVVTGSRGAPQGMGLWLRFERAGLAVEIVRDRGQWMCDLAVPGSDTVGLHIIVSAMDGATTVEIPEDTRSPGDPLPVQLPENVAWKEAVPSTVAWATLTDRTAEIARSSKLWREATLRHWREKGTG